MSFDGRNLAQRIVLAVVAIPLTLWAILSGGVPTAVFALALTILASWEWIGIGDLKRFVGLAVVQMVAPILVVAAWWFEYTEWILPVGTLVLMVSLVFGIRGPWQEEGALRHVGAAVLGIAYVSMFSLLIPISRAEAAPGLLVGPKLLATAFLMVWFTDTFAYFGGSALGRHRLAPSVSPKKSWEGATFGFFGAIAGAFAGAAIFGVQGFARWELAALGAGVGIIGQVGDLAESMLKRDAGVKDSSAILPGHGGILDRFDSLLFTLPVLWIWLLAKAAL